MHLLENGYFRGMLAFTLAINTSVAVAAEDTVPDIGGRLELFTDDFLLDSLDGAALKLHSPIPAETVLAFDKPWEGKFCGYVTVIKDAELYRLYYRGLPEAAKDGSEMESTCYAESTDGIHFTKPDLGLFNVAGTTDNNVILSGIAPLSHNFSPFLDTRPGVDPAQRFKALGGTVHTGLVAFISRDGIHWQKLREEAVITQGKLDSQNVAFWSQSENSYICYLRTFQDGIRTVSRCTSPDFIHWTDIAPMDFGNAPLEHLYTNQTAPYFRAPHIYVAVAARFMPGRRVVSEETMTQIGGVAAYSGDCSDSVFMTTRGGTRYHRTFIEAFIRPGIGPGNWTSRTNYPAYGIVPTGDHEMSLYIQRNYGQLSHQLQRFTLRTDGFVSINGPAGGGEAVTKPFVFRGSKLVINYSTSAAGGLRIGFTVPEGAPIDDFSLENCDEIVGDEIARAVTWQGNSDLSALIGKPVRLRVFVKDADLFSIRFD